MTSRFLLSNVRILDEEVFNREILPQWEALVASLSGTVLARGDVAEDITRDFPLYWVSIVELGGAEAVDEYRNSEFARSRLERCESEQRNSVVLIRTTEPRSGSGAESYLLADTVISNPKRHLEGWVSVGRPLHARYGGSVIGVSSGHTISRTIEELSQPDYPESIEGNWELNRTLLNEFPDQESARGFVSSPEFERAAPVRANAGVYRFALIRGIESQHRK